MKRVLILSASAGAGHLRAADAVEKAFRATGAASEIENIDVLKYTNKAFRALYSKAYIELVNKAPEVLGWLYDRLDVPGKNDRLRLAIDKFNMQPMIRLLKKADADFLVCTHFLPSEIISYLREKEEIRSRHAVVVTDFDVHAMWICRNFEHYFVALDETKVHLEALGISSGSITVSGIPIDPVFAEPKPKAEMRRKHGLDPDRTTILLSAGGFGVGPIEHMMSSLFKLSRDVQVIAICGRSADLKARLEALYAAERPAHVTVKILGFTTEMDELMSASDILLGKPGGLTSSEALAKGLAFVIVNPIPGQEERNSDHLLEQGVAIRCNNLPTLAWKLEQLLADPQKLRAMQERTRLIAKPRAAFTVVERLTAIEERQTSGLK